MDTAALTNEKELLQRTAAGDEQAFTALFDHYHHTLGLHVFHITRSAEQAEEIVQDVFLKIWIAREALNEINDFKSYLFIASKNHALNALKKTLREEQRLQEYTVSAKQQSQADDGRIREIENQYYSLLDEAIAQLPAQQKKVFLLSRRQRMKYEEIAGEMNLSRESVKKYLQHATRSISEYVRAHMDPSLVALLLLSEYHLHQLISVH